MLRRALTNATANFATGVVVAVFQLVMTAIVARVGDSQMLLAWSVVASVAGLAPLLACNLSSIVARRLASADRDGLIGASHQAAVLAAANGVSASLTLAGGIIAIGLAVVAPLLYPRVAGADPLSFGFAVGAYFVGSCWIIAAQPAQGWLVIMHKNWVITVVNAAVRVVTAALVATLLLWLRCALGLALAVGSVGLWLGPRLLRRMLPMSPTGAGGDEERRERAQIYGLIRSFGIWGATSAATQAVTIPVVALVAPQVATSMFVAFVLVTTIVGAIVALGNALIAPLARLLGQGLQMRATAVVLRATVALWVIYAATVMLVLAFLKPITHLWLGSQVIDLPLLRICFLMLSLQHSLRNIGLVSSVALAMGAASRTIVLSSLIEPGLTVTVALPLVVLAGPFAFIAGLAVAGLAGSLGIVYLLRRDTLPQRNSVSLVYASGVLGAGSLAIWLALLWKFNFQWPAGIALAH